MAKYTWVDLHIPEAELFADLNGILVDLRTAGKFAQMLLSEFQAEKTNWELVEPLSIAATVTYCRAFSSGARHHLKVKDLETLNEEQRASHDYIRAYRNKHIAHSLNEFEENIARATYCEERVNDEGITAIGYGGSKVVSLHPAAANAIIELTGTLETHVKAKLKVEAARLLPIVRGMSLEDVLSGGQKVFIPSGTKIDKKRQR